MEENKAALNRELSQEVEALTRSRRIEDRATRMAKEAEVKKVRHAAHRRGSYELTFAGP